MKRLATVYFPKLFWAILILKLISGALFASEFVTKGFLPFITYFLTTGQNPYDHFQLHTVFPYPSGMLYVFALPLFLGKVIFPALFSYPHVALFLFHLPIILADFVIYVILCRLLPTKERSVLVLYFASPVLFYINYYYGQLDVVPTALLFIALYLLFLKRYIQTFLLLGIGLTTKTHLLLTIPLIFLYAQKQKITSFRLILFIVIAGMSFILLNSPFLSTGFVKTVFNNTEQQRLFFFALPYQHSSLSLLIAPGAILLIFYSFFSYKKVNFDSLVLTLGLIFTVLIALVPPMQGWFYWSIPLLVYFLIKYKNSRRGSFWAMNGAILLFYFFTKDSDLFQSLPNNPSGTVQLPLTYLFFQTIGINPLLIQNLLFTIMQVLVGVNAFWCYRIGSFHNQQYVDKEHPFVFGIGGDSGVGKSTVATILQKIIGSDNLVILNGDDAHKWERGDKHWQLYTHLNPAANKLHTDVEQLYALIGGRTIERVAYSHKTGKFSKPQLLSKNQFILFQGLHPFMIKNLREVYDLKIYLEAEEKLRRFWKTERDKTKRRQSEREIKKEIKRRVTDAEKFIYPQKAFADWIIRYEKGKQGLITQHTFINSIPLDDLLQELRSVSSLITQHSYTDMNYQAFNCSGSIRKFDVEKIAYKLYPNLNELVTVYPVFQSDMKGITQLLFINYLNYYYSQKIRTDGRIY